MRILTMLLFTVILGAAGFGAWIMMSSDLPPLLPGKETKQANTPAEQTFRAKQAKWRDAPYVILAPAQTLPEKQSAAPPPPPPEPAKQPKPKIAAPRVAPPAAPRPQAAPPQPAAKSSIAKLALETVIGPQAASQTKAEAAPQPKAPPAAEVSPQTEPPKVAPEQVARAPVPAVQQIAAEKKKLQLPYEAKANSRSETNLKQQSLLAQEQVRFRRPVPLSSGILKSSKMTISLADLDGLVADAQCKYASGKSWECGRWGKYALRRLIRGRSITCDVIEQVTEKIVSARCKVAGVDINKWVVRRGWGRPLGEGAGKYDVALKAAKHDKLGQWSVEGIVKKN